MAWMHACGASDVLPPVLFCLAMLCSEPSTFIYRYDGYDDAYNNASSSLTEEVSSPNGSSKGLQVGSHVIGTHRHRDVWNQQIKESNEKAKTQIKHGFKVGFHKYATTRYLVLVKLFYMLAIFCKSTCAWQIPFCMLDKQLQLFMTHIYSCTYVTVPDASYLHVFICVAFS